jgi:hypothetical protein
MTWPPNANQDQEMTLTFSTPQRKCVFHAPTTQNRKEKSHIPPPYPTTPPQKTNLATCVCASSPCQEFLFPIIPSTNFWPRLMARVELWGHYLCTLKTKLWKPKLEN